MASSTFTLSRQPPPERNRAGLSLLRSVIHIRRLEEYGSMCTEYEVPVFCTSPAQFASAFARLGDAKFELSVRWMPEDISLEIFPQRYRCRCLELGFDPSGRTSPFTLRPMDALEDLRLGQYLTSPNFDMSPELESEILGQVEISAVSLKTLRIYGRYPTSLISRPQLLGRLRASEVVTDDLFATELIESLMHSLSNAVDVLWEPRSAQTTSFSTTHQSLKTLSLLGVCGIHLKGLNNLVNLTVRYSLPTGFEQWAADPDDTLHFPALETVELIGSWSDLQRMRAPLLFYLSLQYPRESNMEIKTLIPRVMVSPKVLKISNDVSYNNLKAFLRGVWSQTEELHLLGCEHREVPSDALVRALSAATKSTRLCPRLWCLTFRVRQSEQADPGTFRCSVEGLRGIHDSRSSSGICVLVRIRRGWDDEGFVGVGTDFFQSLGTWLDVL